MNRAERRHSKKHLKGDHIFMNPGVEKVDHTGAKYCWQHRLQLDNIDKPTDRDKKLIASVTLKPFKITDKKGNVVLGRSCPRCHNTIYVKSTLTTEKDLGILILPEEEKNVDIHLPDLRK